jgi:hypothetical protein
MKINGKLLEVMETQQVSDSFKKRTFIVEYIENPQYPEYISFELTQDRCELIDSFKVNQEVSVSFNLRGRKWTNPQGETKYFNSLQAWRVEAATPGQNPAQPGKPETEPEEDGLPF